MPKPTKKEILKAFDRAASPEIHSMHVDGHETRMRNMKAANDMIDLDLDDLETEPKPKTDYERFIDERRAGQLLRDEVCWLIGLTSDSTSAPQLTVEMAHERLKKALEAHDANRDQG